jgi:hypothetical protein
MAGSVSLGVSKHKRLRRESSFLEVCCPAKCCPWALVLHRSAYTCTGGVYQRLLPNQDPLFKKPTANPVTCSRVMISTSPVPVCFDHANCLEEHISPKDGPLELKQTLCHFNCFCFADVLGLVTLKCYLRCWHTRQVVRTCFRCACCFGWIRKASTICNHSSRFARM